MPVTWIFGQTGSGKTTLSELLLKHHHEPEDFYCPHPYCNAIWLDGDRMREIWTDLGLSKKDRWEQNLRVARLAKMLSEQGKNVVVSVICPYKELRKQVKEICNCKFIYVEGGKNGKERPFDHPKIY